MPADTVLCESLTAGDLDRDRDWWAIYETAFPAREREPRAVILDSLHRRLGIAVRARRGDATVGVATAHVLKAPPAIFLVYLAMAKHARGAGGGRALFECTWQLGAARLNEEGSRAIGMIWEVDDPVEVQDEVERSVRDRRIAFFKRLGGDLLPRDYMQPPVDGVAAVPMRLMYRPAPGGQSVGNPPIEALVRAIYFEKYGAVNHIPADALSRLLGAREVADRKNL
jgi:hypothetical protein